MHTLRFSDYSNVHPSLSVTLEYFSIGSEQIHWHTSHCILSPTKKLKHSLHYSDWHHPQLLKRIKGNIYRSWHKIKQTAKKTQPRYNYNDCNIIKDKKYKMIRSITWRKKKLIWHHCGQTQWPVPITESQRKYTDKKEKETEIHIFCIRPLKRRVEENRAGRDM